MSHHWYLVGCLECSVLNDNTHVTGFNSPQARDTWRDHHRTQTGHDNYYYKTTG